MALSPQSLSLDERRAAALWAARCVEEVAVSFDTAAAADPRVGAAIDQARAFGSGSLDVAEAIRARGGQAGAAAREAPTPATTSLAYAAEQAAAVAHMGAHALGAAGYAARALAFDQAIEDSRVNSWMDDVAARQIALMSAEARSAIAALPALGSHGAGPLGPGRLTRTRYVGPSIRAIQLLLADRGI